jgi:hypothetical protein
MIVSPSECGCRDAFRVGFPLARIWWRLASSRRFFLDEPAPPHSISAASLDHLIGHREDGRRNGHVGAALSHHKRAGRIEERDGKLYAIQSTSMEQQAAL